MSSSEIDGRRVSKRSLPNLDDLTKLLGVLVAVAGVGKYFYDKAEATAHEAQARAISYIEAYGSDPVLGAREALYDFWVGQPELIRIFGSESLSERQYHSMLGASLFRTDADATIRGPLLMLDNFYSQMSFCVQSEICDQEILDSYFCDMTRKSTIAYAPFYDRLRDVTGDSGIGAEMQRFAESCVAEGQAG